MSENLKQSIEKHTLKYEKTSRKPKESITKSMGKHPKSQRKHFKKYGKTFCLWAQWV